MTWTLAAKRRFVELVARHAVERTLVAIQHPMERFQFNAGEIESRGATTDEWVDIDAITRGAILSAEEESDRPAVAAAPASFDASRVKSALENWGVHGHWCAIRRSTTTHPLACDCGFARELAYADSYPRPVASTTGVFARNALAEAASYIQRTNSTGQPPLIPTDRLMDIIRSLREQVRVYDGMKEG